MKTVKQVRERLNRQVSVPPYELGEVAIAMTRLQADDSPSGARELQELVELFKQRAEEVSLARDRLSYATRLAVEPGTLLYEEVQKFIWVCREVYALVSLGVVDPATGGQEWTDWQLALRVRRARQAGDFNAALEALKSRDPAAALWLGERVVPSNEPDPR